MLRFIFDLPDVSVSANDVDEVRSIARPRYAPQLTSHDSFPRPVGREAGRTSTMRRWKAVPRLLASCLTTEPTSRYRTRAA